MNRREAPTQRARGILETLNDLVATSEAIDLSRLVSKAVAASSPETVARMLVALSYALKVPTPTGDLALLPDKRNGFKSQPACLFLVEPSQGTVMQELNNLIGARAANQLAMDWGGRCDLKQRLEATVVALFIDSRKKARDRAWAARDALTTQEDDMKAITPNQYSFATDLAATLLCARIFAGGKTLSVVQELLHQGLISGMLRTRSGALRIENRCLRAIGYEKACENFVNWSLGSSLYSE